MNAKTFSIPIVVALALSGQAFAEPVAQQLPFTVKVPLTSGRPYTFRFSLFDSGKRGMGSELWRESARCPVSSSGTITHNLGSVVPFSEGRRSFDPAADPTPVDFTQQLWVEVASGAFSRRVKLTAVPFALATSGLRVEPTGATPHMIGGNPGNSVAAGLVGATVAGGGSTDNPWDPVAGGYNKVSGSYGFVGGGWGNLAGDHAVVVGGRRNVASGTHAVIVGGENCRATGMQSMVIGGCMNQCSGDAAIVAGGCSNKASAYASFAAGEDANASTWGTFVWSASDDKGPDGLRNSGDDYIFEWDGFPETSNGTAPNSLLRDTQFWVKAPGGVYFVVGKDVNGLPLGVRLTSDNPTQWEPIPDPYSPPGAALQKPAGDVTAGAAPPSMQSLQLSVLELERRLAAQERELTASRAESAALRARLEDLALRQAELRRLLAGKLRYDGEIAAAGEEGTTGY